MITHVTPTLGLCIGNVMKNVEAQYDDWCGEEVVEGLPVYYFLFVSWFLSPELSVPVPVRVCM